MRLLNASRAEFFRLTIGGNVILEDKKFTVGGLEKKMRIDTHAHAFQMRTVTVIQNEGAKINK